MTPSPTDLMASIAREVQDQRYPPVHLWNPDFCGDIDMRIAADGTWFYMGTPITRAPMVRLFASVLRRDEDGKTYLVTPVEKIGITVDDAHFVVILAQAVTGERGPVWQFETQTGDKFFLDGDHPLWVDVDPETGTPRPYVRVRANLDALITRSVFYQLVEAADIRDTDAGVEVILTSAGQDWSLGVVTDMDAQPDAAAPDLAPLDGEG